jgi:hypothetical protein
LLELPGFEARGAQKVAPLLCFFVLYFFKILFSLHAGGVQRHATVAAELSHGGCVPGGHMHVCVWGHGRYLVFLPPSPPPAQIYINIIYRNISNM